MSIGVLNIKNITSNSLQRWLFGESGETKCSRSEHVVSSLYINEQVGSRHPLSDWGDRGLLMAGPDPLVLSIVSSGKQNS